MQRRFLCLFCRQNQKYNVDENPREWKFIAFHRACKRKRRRRFIVVHDRAGCPLVTRSSYTTDRPRQRNDITQGRAARTVIAAAAPTVCVLEIIARRLFLYDPLENHI